MVGKKVLRKARIREILGNYKSFLSIILIATLCVALFTGLYANYKNFEIRVDDFYEQTNMADYFVTTKSYDSNDLNHMKSDIEGITDIERRIYTPFQKDSKNITLIAVENDSKICKPIIEEGKEGVLVSPTFITSMDCSIGDTFIIPFENTIQGVEIKLELEFVISGVMRHPEDVEKNSVSQGLMYMPIDTLKSSAEDAIENTYSPIMASMILVQFDINSFVNQYVMTSDRDVSEDLNTYFMNKKESNLLSSLARDSFPTNSSIEMDVVQARQLLYVFPVVFYLVGILVIITSLKELIQKERKNIGLFSAIGFSKAEIILHYSYISIMLVSIGAILGLLIGPALIPNIMGSKYNVLYNLPKTNVPIFYMAYLYCFILIVGISILSSILVSYKEVNRNPATILRNDNRKSLKHSNGRKHKQGLLPLKMSFRSMRLNLVRSFMVLIGVLGCSALLVCGFGIDDTLNHSVEEETKKLIAYDLMVNYSSEISFIEYGIEAEDPYEHRSIIALHDGKSYSTSIYIFEENREIFKPTIPQNGCMISRRIAEDLNLSIGDTVTYIYNNESVDVEVQEIQEMSFTSGIFISSLGYESYQPNASYLTLKDKSMVDEVKEQILDAGASSVVTSTELEEQADNILSGIRGITLTVKVFAILLALVVIYNLAQLNYKERIRDIATLKVLGFGKFEIAQTLLYELTSLTLVGSILGMLLGKPLLILLLKINQTARFTYIYYISVPSYIIAIALTLVISIIINLFITKLSDKIQMVESLKSVE